MKPKTGIFSTIVVVFILTLMGITQSFAQDEGGFVVVHDSNDTFVNLRADANAKSVVKAKLKNGAVGYSFPGKGDWVNFEYMAGHDSLVSGFVHKSLIKDVSGFQELKSGGDEETATFTGNNIKVTLSQKAFNKQGHTVTYYKDDPKILDKIDGKRFWGTDGGMPVKAYSEISVTFGSKTIKLPKEAMADVFEPNYEFTKVYYDKGNDILYITASNSDGAGGYDVAWVIENKKYRDRTVAIPY